MPDIGKVEYQWSCVACHGIDGKGTGPLATELKTKPADLTLIAKMNKGVFPSIAYTRPLMDDKTLNPTVLVRCLFGASGTTRHRFKGSVVQPLTMLTLSLIAKP